MTTVIKGGKVVTAALSFEADVLIEGETHQATVGPDLRGRHDARRGGLLRDAGRHRPAYPPGNALYGHHHGRQLRDRHASAALSGGTTMVVDFCIPNHGQPLMEAMAGLGPAVRRAPRTDYSFHMCRRGMDGRNRVKAEMADGRGDKRRDHLQVFHGLQGRPDGRTTTQMFASFQRCAELGAMPLVHAENGEVVAALAEAATWISGITGPEGAWLFPPPGRRGRSRQSRHHAGRSGRCAALHRPHLLDSRPTRRSSEPGRPGKAGLWRAA